MPSAPTPTPSPQESHLQSNNSSSEWNPYVIVPLIVVCIAILFFSYYRILKQLLCGLNPLNFSRNQVRMRHLNLNDLQDPSSLQFQSRGLESTIMHSLPITQFKKKLKVGEEVNECAVCLGEFEEGEWLKHLPVCSHVFHVACIDTWFQTHSNCPICRSYVCDLSQDYSISMNSLIETLRREDFFRQTEQHYQNLR